MSNVCNVSSDCDRVFNDGIVRHCYESASFSDEEFFCDCSNWYGWTGDKCDEVSGQLIYWRTALIFTSAWSVLLAIAYVITMVPMVKNLKKNADLKLLLIVSLCFLLSTTCISLSALLVIHPAFDPTKFKLTTVQTVNGEEQTTVVALNSEVSYFAVAFALVFVLSGSMFIILSWINVLKQSSKVFPGFLSKGELYLSQFLKVFVTLSFGVVVTLVALKSLELLLFYAALLLFLVLGMYSYLTCAFIRRIQKVAGKTQDSMFGDAVSLVKEAFIYFFTCILVGMVALLTAQVTAIDYFEKLDIGQFNVSLFLLDVATWTALFKASFALRYIRARVKAIRSSRAPTKTMRLDSAKTFSTEKMSKEDML